MVSRSERAMLRKVGYNDSKVLWGPVKEFVIVNLQVDSFAPVKALE